MYKSEFHVCHSLILTVFFAENIKPTLDHDQSQPIRAVSTLTQRIDHLQLRQDAFCRNDTNPLNLS